MKQLIFVLLILIFILPVAGQVLDAGNGHALVLDRHGKVWTIGRNNYGQLGDSTLNNSPIPKRVERVDQIIAISRGYDHSIALDKNGNLFLWGRNNYGQLGCLSSRDQWLPQQLPVHKGFIAAEGGHWHTVG